MHRGSRSGFDTLSLGLSTMIYLKSLIAGMVAVPIVLVILALVLIAIPVVKVLVLATPRMEWYFSTVLIFPCDRFWLVHPSSLPWRFTGPSEERQDALDGRNRTRP
jgi:hypothetical protein